MKKLIHIIILPLFLFIGCDELDDLNECNDLTETYNASVTQFNQDNTTANCNKMYDDLIDLIEKDCQTNLEGTGLENIPADTVRAWKNLCFIYDVIGG